MSTALHKRILAFDYSDQETTDLMMKVWAVTPFVVNVRTGSVNSETEREIAEWCCDNFGQDAWPMHGKPGKWQRGSATVHGETFMGFDTAETLAVFMERFGHLVIEDEVPSPQTKTKAEIKWIEWTGGDFLPVPPEMRVTVLLRDDSIEGPAPAREFGGDESCWKHRDAAGDIVAYTSDLLFAAPTENQLGGLPQDVINLVIAAREFWEIAMDESDESAALDAALEAFSSRVPYDNEPIEASQLPQEQGEAE